MTSNVTTTTEEVEDVYVPRFVQTTMPPSASGFPGLGLYVISDARDIEEIDKLEESVYYVLACSVTTGTTGTGKAARDYTNIIPGLYKRIRNVTGHALVEVNDGSRLDFAHVTERAVYGLPPMPMDFINKIDFFLREINRIHRTESIVILGYDTDYKNDANPGLGWVVYVPEQKNTSARCDYEPDSILSEKADSVLIVGTIHSHPEMSAFASSTDHGDQFNNDGLHITIAWKGQGPSEYYIEYQSSNARWTLDPEQVFDYGVQPTYEIEPWISKVSKATPPPIQATKALAGKSTTPSTTSTASSNSRLHGEYWRETHNAKRPQGVPDLVKNVVIAFVEEKAEACPVCTRKFDQYSVRNRRCTSCFSYLLLDSDHDDVYSILKARQQAYNNEAYMPGLEFLTGENIKSDFNVLLWDHTKQKLASVTSVYDPKNGISKKYAKK